MRFTKVTFSRSNTVNILPLHLQRQKGKFPNFAVRWNGAGSLKLQHLPPAKPSQTDVPCKALQHSAWHSRKIMP